MTINEYNRLLQNRGKSAASEHDLQVQCVRWFRYSHKDIANLLFAIPNGGWRNATIAAKLKAEGVVAGIPDLFLAVPSKGFHDLWIEMKNGKAGRVSNNQNTMIKQFLKQGYQCKVCRSQIEFDEIIREYLQ